MLPAIPPLFIFFAFYSTVLFSAIPGSGATANNSERLTSRQIQQMEVVAQSAYWHRLLHYKRSLPLLRLKSEIDGAGFFFHLEGSTSPLLELRASVEAFSKDIQVGRFKQHPQCAFPERYRFLKRALQLSAVDVPCPHLDEHLKHLNSKAVALVFSSAHSGSPASMFGHTFLKFLSDPSETKKKRADLLDWGMGYAAQVPQDTNGLEFMIKGLAGGFVSQFSLLPYYEKVNEYVNAESRDIWEYELSLNEEETLRLIRHIWEIDTNAFSYYYFFDKNCSYKLMALLEVARPDWNISHFGPHVVPGETVKRITALPGAVKSVRFRQSLKRKAMERFTLLDAQEKERFRELLRGAKEVESETSTPVLESLGTFLQFQKELNDGVFTEDQKKLFGRTLLTRSKMGMKQAPNLYAGPIVALETVDSRPEIGHGPYMLGTAAGVYDFSQGGIPGSFFQDFRFKFAYHDLHNNDSGFIRYSHIDFPNFTLRYIGKENRLSFEKIEVLSITSITPLSLFERKLSFGVGARLHKPKDLDCHDCGTAQLEAGVGAALPILSPANCIYGLLWTSVEVGGHFPNFVRGGPKPNVGILLNPVEKYKFQINASLPFDVFQSSRRPFHLHWELKQSYALSQSFDVRTSIFGLQAFDGNPSLYREMRIEMNYFF